MSAAIAYGMLGSGFNLVGPFEGTSEAIEWAQKNLDGEAGVWEAVEMMEPWGEEDE